MPREKLQFLDIVKAIIVKSSPWYDLHGWLVVKNQLSISQFLNDHPVSYTLPWRKNRFFKLCMQWHQPLLSLLVHIPVSMTWTNFQGHSDVRKMKNDCCILNFNLNELKLCMIVMFIDCGMYSREIIDEFQDFALWSSLTLLKVCILIASMEHFLLIIGFDDVECQGPIESCIILASSYSHSFRL